MTSVNGHGRRSAASVDQVMTSLSRAQILQCLAFVQRRQDRDEVIQRLLEARLASLTAAPVETREKFLTVDEVAARLRLTRARVYELVRQRKLPKCAGLGTQVRIPASALTGTQRAP